mgnify:CR=1 FL=1
MRRIECGDECAAFLSKERWHEEAIQELRRFKFVYREFKNPGRKAAYEAKLFDLVPNRTELKAQSHGRCAFVGGGHGEHCAVLVSSGGRPGTYPVLSLGHITSH